MHVLIALKDPSDDKKMDKAETLTKQQFKRYKKKKDFVLPLEWLHPKNGRDIESIDCLLHHDDLIKGTNMSSQSDKTKLIEDSLFEKNIIKWEGTITAIDSKCRHGTITFKGSLPVRFVPLNVQPSMPSVGDTLKFCLSFDRFGLSAWQVRHEGQIQHSDFVGRHSDDDSSSEHSEQEDVQNEDFPVAPPLDSIRIPEPDEKQTRNENKGQQPQDEAVSKKLAKWDEQRKQGVVSFANPEMGAGFIENADVEDKLFRHAQLREPVKDLEGNIVTGMLLDLKVEKLIQLTRAADIRVLKVSKCKRLLFSIEVAMGAELIPEPIGCYAGFPLANFFARSKFFFCLWSLNWN